MPLKSAAALVEYMKNPKKLLHKLGFKVKFNSIDHLDCLRKGKCSKGWKSTLEYLDKISDYSIKNNASLAILNIPVREQLAYDRSLLRYEPDMASMILGNYSAKKRIIFIDLLESSLGSGDYYALDGHFNPLGYEKAAQYTYMELRSYLEDVKQ